MKKLFFIALASCTLTIAAHAQTDSTKKITKEERLQMKAQKEAQLNDAIKQLGLTDDQAAQVKNTLNTAQEKNMALRKNTLLDDNAKAEQRKQINQEKNDALKQIMGKDKFKQWNEIRKSQRQSGANGGWQQDNQQMQ